MDLGLVKDDFALGRRSVSAVVLFTYERVTGLYFSQPRCVPRISIPRGINEIGSEMVAYMHNPTAAPVVIGTEWLIGTMTVPEFAKALGRVHDITVCALLDEQHAFAPAAKADHER